jgi:hypothetical protein
MSARYVLVDFENVQPTALAALSGGGAHVLVFVGASQTKLPFALVSAMQQLGPRAEYIKISGNGKNALDFHIAYYLGALASKHPGAEFLIVSKDTGFDPMIAHLRTIGVRCTRSAKVAGAVATKTTAGAATKTAEAGTAKMPTKPAGKPKPKASNMAHIDVVIERLTAPKATKPRTRTKLGSSINALFQKQLSEAEVAALIAQLTNKGLIALEGEKVVYR